MKSKILVKKFEPIFEPITVEITFESPEEIAQAWLQLNLSSSALDGYYAKYVSGSDRAQRLLKIKRDQNWPSNLWGVLESVREKCNL